VTYPHAGQTISDTCRQPPRLTEHYTPADLRWERYVSEMVLASDTNEALLAEAHDTLFRLWKFIRNLQTCSPPTGASSSNASPNPSAPVACASNLRRPICEGNLSDALPTSHEHWPYQVLSH
jgi:hypothetical protein